MRNGVPHRVFVSGSFTNCKRHTISETQPPILEALFSLDTRTPGYLICGISVFEVKRGHAHH